MDNISFPNTPPPLRPEENLERIRELTERNEKILEKLLIIEEKRESRRKWKIFGSFLMIILPYIFMILATWYFYVKVAETVDRLQVSVSSVVPKIPDSWKEKAEDLKQKVLEIGK